MRKNVIIFIVIAFAVTMTGCNEEESKLTRYNIGTASYKPSFLFSDESVDYIEKTQGQYDFETTTDTAYKTLKQAGAKIVYREFAGCTHNSWNPAFNDPDLFTWLFKQKK